jgi:hypothetical protein
MEHTEHFEDGAVKGLDAIHSGGRHTLVVIRQRIGEALDELDKGDFTEAQQKLALAAGMASNLSHAQQYIAIADGSRLIKATELQVGMELTRVGTVTAVEREDCPVCGQHVKIKVGEHDVQYHSGHDVYVVDEQAV